MVSGKRNLTCMVVSLITTPPAEIQATNCSLSFLLLENKYAASGFVPEFTISKLSSNLSTCSSPANRKGKRSKEEDGDDYIICSPSIIVLHAKRNNFLNSFFIIQMPIVNCLTIEHKQLILLFRQE